MHLGFALQVEISTAGRSTPADVLDDFAFLPDFAAAEQQASIAPPAVGQHDPLSPTQSAFALHAERSRPSFSKSVTEDLPEREVKL